MEEFLFKPFKIIDKRVNLEDHKINSYNLLEFLFLSSPPKKIARIFNQLIEDRIIKIEEEQEYEVEAILDESEDDNVKQYLVKWKNWHVEFCTWEPFTNLSNCKEEFILYEKRKLENRKGGIGVDYLQPKLELIRQIMTIVIECHLKPFHIHKYLSQQKNPLKRKVPTKMTLKNTKRTKIVLNTLKQALHDWETLINQIYPLFKVTVENKIDTEGPPLDFQFITDYVSSSVEIPTEPPMGCGCTIKCAENKKECTSAHGSVVPYTATGKIKIPHGQPVYECNSACSCGKECSYRVIQNGMRLQLKIFRTNNRGWGLKTINKIQKGSFIMEYLGEIVTVDEAEERGKLYDQQNLTYLFDLDFAGDPEFTIDAYKKGNLAHFINHSCNPNMTSRCVYINNLDIRMPRIAFFAARDIRACEELTFDYMMTGAMTDSKENDGSVAGTSISDSLKPDSSVSDIYTRYDAGSENTSVTNSIQNPNRVKCLCRARNCRKYLY